MRGIFFVDLKYFFNKKALLSFLVIVFFMVVIFNVLYKNVFTSIDDVNYERSIKQLETQYFHYIQQRYGYNHDILDNVISLDPVIVISTNFFQLAVSVFMLIWFHSYISREIESGVFSRNVTRVGRFKYLLARFFIGALILIPALAAMQFSTMVISQNKFIAVNMDKQWPVIFQSAVSNGFFLLVIFSFLSSISVFARNSKRSFVWISVFIFVNYILLASPLKFLSPYFYRDWMFHKNHQIFYTQLGIYLFFITTIILITGFLYRKLNLTAYQETLKW